MSNDNTFFEQDHDEEEIPFAQIPNELLRDKNLSLEVRAMICYLLSHRGGWRINVKQMLSSMCEGLGKNKLYRMIDEAIEAGYLKRESIRDEKNRNFKRFKYLVSRTPKFKKFLPCPCFGEVQIGDAQNGDTKEDYLLSSSSLRSEESKKEYHNTPEVKEPPAKPASAHPSGAAEELSVFFFQKLKEEKKDFKEPNLKKWAIEIDRIIRIDKRSPEEVADFIVWVRQDESFWKAVCLSPENLRKNWEKIAAAREKTCFHDNVKENKDYAIAFKQHFKIKELRWDAKFVYNDSKHKEIPFSLPNPTFKKTLDQMFDME